jgi:hypothetical protein
LYIGPTNHLSHYLIFKEQLQTDSMLLHDAFSFVKNYF